MRKPTTMRFDDATYQRLEGIKTELHMTQTEALEEAIRLFHKTHVEQKPAVVRWIDISKLPGRRGEIVYGDWANEDTEDDVPDCPHCSLPIDRPHKALMADGTWSETVCSRCAFSE